MSLLSSYASPWKIESDQLNTKKRTPQIKNINSAGAGQTEATSNSIEVKENMVGNSLPPSDASTVSAPTENTNDLKDVKMKNLLNKITNNNTTDGTLTNFNPPPNPIINKKDFNPMDLLPAGTPSPPIYKNIESYIANENNLGIYNNYKKSYEAPKNLEKPYYSKMGISSSNLDDNDKLLEKINYMIHLLEEQQNEKTNNETEEFILYSFLGIFIIFIVDSFTKVGKYTR